MGDSNRQQACCLFQLKKGCTSTSSPGRILLGGFGPTFSLARWLAPPCAAARVAREFSSSSASRLIGAIELRETTWCFLSPIDVTLLQLQEKTLAATLRINSELLISVFAFFLSLRCIRRRQLRSSPMSLPIFNGEDSSVLSSVL
jgi:hypothetical protein